MLLHNLTIEQLKQLDEFVSTQLSGNYFQSSSIYHLNLIIPNYSPILLTSQDENNKLKCNNPSDFWMMSTYDYEFVSAIHHENINGTQFHPEKSQDAGYELLKKFAEL